MALVTENMCSQYSNVMVPRRYRQRPKLVPPKNKRFTRARVNLNQIWPHLEEENGDQSFVHPFISANPVRARQLQSRYPAHQQQKGNSDSENFGNFSSNSLLLDRRNIGERSDSVVFNHIKFFPSCYKKINRTLQELDSCSNCQSSEKVYAKSPMKLSVTLDDLATVLSGCEIMPSGRPTVIAENHRLGRSSARIENDKENRVGPNVYSSEETPALLEPDQLFSI